MSELTREYLDKKLYKLVTKDDIKGVKVFVKTEIMEYRINEGGIPVWTEVNQALYELEQAAKTE